MIWKENLFSCKVSIKVLNKKNYNFWKQTYFSKSFLSSVLTTVQEITATSDSTIRNWIWNLRENVFKNASNSSRLNYSWKTRLHFLLFSNFHFYFPIFCNLWGIISVSLLNIFILKFLIISKNVNFRGYTNFYTL